MMIDTRDNKTQSELGNARIHRNHPSEKLNSRAKRFLPHRNPLPSLRLCCSLRSHLPIYPPLFPSSLPSSTSSKAIHGLNLICNWGVQRRESSLFFLHPKSLLNPILASFSVGRRACLGPYKSKLKWDQCRASALLISLEGGRNAKRVTLDPSPSSPFRCPSISVVLLSCPSFYFVVLCIVFVPLSHLSLSLSSVKGLKKIQLEKNDQELIQGAAGEADIAAIQGFTSRHCRTGHTTCYNDL